MRALALALVLFAAGCVQVDPASVPDARDLIGEPIVQTHDHTDASLHTGRANVRLVSWNPLIPEELGEEGFAGMRIVDHYAYIGTDGAHAGFLVVDVEDPTSPRLVGQYVTGGGASQEAVPSWDGKWVFMNLQRQPGVAEMAAAPERGTGLGIHVVNVEDKANPRFESFFPVETYGTHVMYYYEMGGKSYLFFNGQPTRHGIPTGEVYTQPVGNVVKIAEFVEVGGAHTLRVVGEYRYVPGVTGTHSQGCFPHDMWVEKHPTTGKHVMYVAHWDCGAVTVDVTDPANPVTLDAYDDLEPSTRNRIHFVRPDPVLRDGRVVAFSGPEIDESPGEPGYIRVYDVTDPEMIDQIGAWRLPGEVENDQPFLFTPHNFDFDCPTYPQAAADPALREGCDGSLMAVAHYHAGVWVLDVSDPKDPAAVGFYLPHGDEEAPYDGPVWRKTPNFPVPYLPNAYEAKWYQAADGETYLLVSERGTGLYVLQYTDL